MPEITIRDSADARMVRAGLDDLYRVREAMDRVIHLMGCAAASSETCEVFGREAPLEIQAARSDMGLDLLIADHESALSEYAEGPMPWPGRLLASEVI